MSLIAPNVDEAEAQPILSREFEAAKLLISQLKMMGENLDEDLVGDMVEGETELFEAIDRVCGQIGEDAALVEALKIQEKQLEARRHRLEMRNRARKDAVENALRLTKRSKHRNALCDINVARKAPPSLEIVNEAMIPARYWIPGEPKLDKRLLLSDVKEAIASNGGIEGVKLAEPHEISSWKWS
jgi:hypothetical protein